MGARIFLNFGEVPTSLKKLSRDMGYRSDSVAVSRDMGPLRSWAILLSEGFRGISEQFGARSLQPLVLKRGMAVRGST